MATTETKTDSTDLATANAKVALNYAMVERLTKENRLLRLWLKDLVGPDMYDVAMVEIYKAMANSK